MIKTFEDEQFLPCGFHFHNAMIEKANIIYINESLTIVIKFNFQDNATGFARLPIYSESGDRGSEVINDLLKLTGKTDWRDLEGSYVRVDVESFPIGSVGTVIANIIENDYIDLDLYKNNKK